MVERRSFPRGRLLHGDCLEVLPRAVARSRQRFDLVYVDPPFNTGVAHRARAGRGARAEGERAYHDAWGGLDAFLAMLEPRLALLRELMSESSSLWLHLDHRGVHDAKVLADRIFGRERFRGEVVWVPGNGARNRRGPSVTHQTLLIYSRGRDLIWNYKDPLYREPFAGTSLDMHFSHVDGSGRRFRERTLGGKTYRYYADEGRQIGSVWTDCPAMHANTPLRAETTGYPTQKPERLLERILRVASLPESRVLDPMCGSGTTLAVADRLGRRWLGADQSPLAFEIASRRLAGTTQERERPEPKGSGRSNLAR